MAIPVSVVRRYEEDVLKIDEMSDAAVQQLITALESAPLTIDPNTIASELAPKVEGISKEYLSELLPPLLSLCTIRDQFESSSAEVAETLSRNKEGADRSHFEGRLKALLEARALNIVAKAGALMIEQPRFMRRARILTDIRPVFGTTTDESPIAAVVVHTLRLSYFENNETKEFFVALDGQDLRTLRDQLNRASSKATSLKEVINETPIDYVDSE
jgi:hypothetical protein